MFPFLKITDNFQIDMYWVLIFTGLIAVYILANKFKSRINLKGKDLDLYIVFGVLLGFVGSRVFSFIFRIPEMFAGGQFNKEVAEELISTYFMFYGGLIGGMIGVFLYAKIAKLDWLKIYDYAAIFVPLAYAFGRLGCFCAGCCYGFETEHGMHFYGSKGTHFPIQLVDSGLNFIFFGIMFWLFYSKRTEKRGVRSCIFLYTYAVMRFVLEYFRGDDYERGGFLGLSTSQFISILMVVFATFLLLVFVLNKKDGDKPEELKDAPKALF